MCAKLQITKPFGKDQRFSGADSRQWGQLEQMAPGMSKFGICEKQQESQSSWEGKAV